MAKRRGWSQFSTEEKLEALRDDLNRALDLAERNGRRLDTAEENIKRISAYIRALQAELQKR